MSGHCVDGILFNRAEKENLGESSFDELCPGLQAVLEGAEANRNFEINVTTVSDAELAPARKKKRRNGPASVNRLETRVLDAVQDLTTKVTDFKEANRALERMLGTASTTQGTLSYQRDMVNTKRTALLDGVKGLSLMSDELQDAKEGVVPDD